MTTNGINSVEEADMSDCNGEKVVTMMDVLQQQQEFEDDANAVLGASDDKDCTYPKGYIKRQAIYACLTCCSEAKEDASKRAGVCLACSLNCHENHDLIELYTKRNFRCDCGNPKFGSNSCQFVPDKSELNAENRYNQNFSGIYCVCNRPYPDPDLTNDDEMIQCIICEDWLHSTHLEVAVPCHDQYSEMICKSCMDKNDFLHDYADFAITVENENVDVVNNTALNDTSICDNSLVTDSECDKTTLNDTTNNLMNSNETTDNVNHEEKPDSVPEIDDQTNSTTTETNTHTNEVAENTNDETVADTKPSSEENEVLPSSEIDDVSEPATSETTNITDDVTEKPDKEETDTNKVDNSMEVDSDHKEIDAIDKFLAGDDEISDTKDNEKSAENVANILKTNESEKVENGENETADKGETESSEKETSSETLKVEINSSEQMNGAESDLASVALESNEITTDSTKNAELCESPDAETSKSQEPAVIGDTSTDTEKSVVATETEKSVASIETNDTTETKSSSEITAESNDNSSKVTEPIINNDTEMNEQGDGDSTNQENNDHKRKLSIENSDETSVSKKPKTSSDCSRPKATKVLNGSTFWPSTFRQKLCTCSECIAMYKDLSVLFLTDPEDTVGAYEALGKEKGRGAGGGQYEQGLEALSSLGRTQQINALTEYNNMRDKLLDFLKSFKERREVVKEEDIKQFFAGMKAKREPDGVYFCR